MTNNNDGLLGTLPETAADKLRHIQIQKVSERMNNPASFSDAKEVDHRPASERFGTTDPDEIRKLVSQEEKKKCEAREQKIRESLTDEEIALEDAIEFEKIFCLEPTFPDWLGPNWTWERFPREKTVKWILTWFEAQMLLIRWAIISPAVEQADQLNLVVHIRILIKALQEIGVNQLLDLDDIPLYYRNDSTGRHDPWPYKPAKVLQVLEEVTEVLNKCQESDGLQTVTEVVSKTNLINEMDEKSSHTVENESEYIPAMSLINTRREIADHNQLKKFLKENAQIRRFNPSRNRLKIHGNDWFDYWRDYEKKMFEQLDNTGKPMTNYLAGIEEQKIKIRKK